MTLITGQVSDVGMNNASGVFHARATEFRGDGTTVVSPSPATFTITGGALSADIAPGPTFITLHVGPFRKDWFVNVPETAIGLGDLIDEYAEDDPVAKSAVLQARDDALEAQERAEEAAQAAETAANEAKAGAPPGVGISMVTLSHDEASLVFHFTNGLVQHVALPNVATGQGGAD